MKGVTKMSPFLLGRSFGLSVLSSEESETIPYEANSQRDCVFGKIRGLEVDSSDIDELVEDHNEELTTEELMGLHGVSQQEVMEVNLSEEEEITAKQQSLAQ
ncbi:hypothetical protein AVEN_229929-1 [Araneus ventricosus]|uniref:Uncharacterized protein n=1 Tax=Araneus ventricosus TaxID=182803 RepID=A0A4Y2BXI2_ARAVE|nr:hypothetical protein AVEN_229929-1 [Araneus ventricosus]